jgi:hypothetical protein
MTLLSWPTLLPIPQRAGNARMPVDVSARSQIHGGATLARQRFSRVRENCPVTFMMSPDQLAVFDAWWTFSLGQGCGWFLSLLRGEMDVAMHACRMAAGYRAELVGAARWKITAQLELDDPPHLSADDYAGILLLGTTSATPAAMGLHYLVHVSIPARILP